MKKTVPVLLLSILLFTSCGAEQVLTKNFTQSVRLLSSEWSKERREREFTVLGKTYVNGSEPIEIACDENLTVEDLDGLQYLDNPILLDLRGPVYTLEEMQVFARTYPEAEFRFSFEIAGVSADWGTEELDLSNIQFASADEVSAYFPYLPNLKELIMCDCGISNEDMAVFRGNNPDIKIVWMLHLGTQYSIRTDVTAFSTLRASRGQIYSEDCEIFKYCTNLKALDIGHLHITSIDFLRYLPDLRVLIISDNFISDISPLADLHYLTYLELFVNYGFTSFEPLSRLRYLRDLNVSWVNARDFEYLYSLPSLRRLWASQGFLSTAQQREIKQSVPEGCEVLVLNGQESTEGWRNDEIYSHLNQMFHNREYDEFFEPDFSIDEAGSSVSGITDIPQN